jgi:hypothetical protein
MTTVQFKTDSHYADANGVVVGGDYIAGPSLDGVVVLNIGAYCVAVPGGTVSGTDWSTTPPSGSGSGPEVGALLLPEAGTWIIAYSGGNIEKDFYWRAWPGVLTMTRWWRIIS